MAAPSYASRRDVYRKQWETMSVEGVGTIDKAARTLIVNKQRYINVAAKVGCPWFFIAVCHWREASGSFAGVMHNGERIIGKGVKTRLVPKGRGPFATWEASGVDALSNPPHDMRKVKFDGIERFAYEAEKWNGWGYYYKGVPSAYLWSFSNIYRGGKYVADGVWSSTAKDQQVGVMPLLKRMMIIDASINFGGAPSDLEPITLPPPPDGPTARNLGPVAGGAGAIGIGAVAASQGLPWGWLAAGLAVIAVAGASWYYRERIVAFLKSKGLPL